MAPNWIVSCAEISAGRFGSPRFLRYPDEATTIRRETRASVLVADAGTAARERFGESVAPDLLVPLKQLGLLDEFRAGGH